MNTLSGIVETLEHGMYLVRSTLDKIPSTDARFLILRGLVQQVADSLALNDMRVALAEVEADYSARAQAIADAWPSEPTKPE